MRTIHIMSGLPGSGKTTYVNNYAGTEDIRLHRDEFRATLRALHKTDKYFPLPPKEEWGAWIDYITAVMTNHPSVDLWIDQTTLGQTPLNKLLDALKPYLTNNDWVAVVIIHTCLKVCKERQANREGFYKVPLSIIEDMHKRCSESPISESATQKRYPGYAISVHHITDMEG